jgi:hypothetical protein
MADFARVLAVVDQLFGTDGLARFMEQAQLMAEDSLSSNPFLARLHEMEIDFTGKAAELLVKATPDRDGWRPPRDWPKDPRAVTSLLKRNAPALRKAGWVVEDEPDRDHFIIWTLRHPEKVGNQGPQSPRDPQGAKTEETADTKYRQTQDEVPDVAPGSEGESPPISRCIRCGFPLHRVLVEAGETTHPLCGDES